ncbi:hypothetical protein MFKK_25150 [Halopseudomonas aestusnigri]|uniref:hypothetical protein n=1 Tax=Halopseudomonas TaxID=2901189 RepID=UPI0022B72F2C|nr:MULTISPECIES: hypothetical protein [Halopseudomonas]BDX19705.1 hypothetical protein MFKK_25150 [Halopseudomonas aestusnigri]
MSKFEELSKLEKSRMQREENFWKPLQDAAGNTVRAFENFLELPDKTYELNGKKERYVSLGLYQDEQFKELRPFQLPGADWAILFAIAVTIETAPNAYPKRRIAVRCEALYDERGLLICIEPGAEHEERIHIVGQDSHVAVAESIYRVVQSILDVQFPYSN